MIDTGRQRDLPDHAISCQSCTSPCCPRLPATSLWQGRSRGPTAAGHQNLPCACMPDMFHGVLQGTRCQPAILMIGEALVSSCPLAWQTSQAMGKQAAPVPHGLALLVPQFYDIDMDISGAGHFLPLFLCLNAQTDAFHQLVPPASVFIKTFASTSQLF